MPKIMDDASAKAALLLAKQNVPQTFVPGRWEGGRLFLTDFGEEVFIPCGSARESFPGPMTLLGDAQRNVIGWGEVRMTNPIPEAM